MESRFPWFRTRKNQERLKDIATYLLLCMGGTIILIPFFWMVTTAFKTSVQALIYPPVWIPNPIVLTNFSEGWSLFPFNRYFMNTCFITGVSVLGRLITCSLVAFSFARVRFPGKNVLFLVVLSTLMLPYQVTMIPLYIIYSKIGWIDTFKPLTVPMWFCFGQGAFFIFLLRQYYTTIPMELDDAARIDGCSLFRIFCQIILPLSKPVLGLIAIFSFMTRWNDFLQPLIYLKSTEKYTLSVGLTLFQGQYHVDWPELMAVSLVILLPPVCLFFYAQRHYIQGVVVTGIKG